ncbi:transmembrane protease serine 9-like [Eupeodes corollae]|uniref:transmembrane protease serine 9-like n=1 Tax=Eupeodes corollae TaxID=290404 RepID=UPI002491F3FA|nr:transmembrane protease serine 9-like [Eupeodes corollae]
MFKQFFTFSLLVIVLILSFHGNEVNAQKYCTTPDGFRGSCVPVTSCQTIKQLLEIFPRPLPSSVQDIIRRSYCGTVNKVYYVCCDIDSINSETTTRSAPRSAQPTTTTRRPRRPTVSTSDSNIRRSSDFSNSEVQSGMSILDKLKTQCGKSDADRIANGEEANLSEYPWMALLIYSDGVKRSIQCGGTLITDRYVLTAAHCILIKPRPGKLVSVRLGEHDTTETIDCVGRGAARKCAPPLQEIDVEEAIYHKNFNRNAFSNDIGVVRLSSPAIFRSNVRPICLPITERSMSANLENMIIAGWGKVETDNPATILQKATVPVRTNEYCDKKLGIVELTEYHLCAAGGEKNIHTCVGDSGGPLFYSVPFVKAIRYVQYGVTSGGSSECGLDYPNIFSNVKKFLPWIAANLKESCTTLRGQTGACVPILTCKTITQLLSAAPKPLPPSITELVKLSECKTFNDVHYVCCDANSIDNEATTEKQTTKPQTKPEVSESDVKVRRSSEVSDTQIESGMGILDKFKKQCGRSDADKVSNGEDANLSEYPWMALLVYSDGVDRTLDCGGSLITDRYVLTAAHCIRVGNKQLVSVRLGEHDTKEAIDCVGKGAARKCAPPIQEIDIEEAVYHKDFRPSSFLNDIGLVRLISPATLQNSVRPVCLPITKRSMAAVVDQMIIAGWGKVETGTPATILQKAVIPIRENDYCDNALKVIKLTENQLCAGGGDKKIDTCLGDSGGPIFYTVPFRKGIRYVQYGVVSGGSFECGLEFPSIFSRVKNFLPWIAGNLRS